MSDTTSSTDQHAAYAAHHSQLTGIAMVLKAAEAQELPAPSIVVSNAATIHARTWEDFQAWVAWLDVDDTVVATRSDGVAVLWFEATGTLFDVELRLVVRRQMAPVCPCGHRASDHTAIGCLIGSCACFHTEPVATTLGLDRAARPQQAVTV